MRTRNKRTRGSQGVFLTEFAAALVVILAICITVGFACYEVCMSYMIYHALNHSAHAAAMALSKAYGGDSTIACSPSAQEAILESITYSNMVISPNQFTVTFPSSPSQASWTSSGNTPTVVVTCAYTGGQNGLPTFPNPDPLQLGSTFTLKAQAIAYLE